jgi:enoyl-CoA hydratase
MLILLIGDLIMTEKNLLCNVTNGIGYITINRSRKFNSLSKETLEELAEALNDWKDDKNCRVVIITGAGNKAFSSGADLNDILEERKKGRGMGWAREGQKIFAILDGLGKPSIAAVNGTAFGGGFELSLACTFRIASENARFAFPEIKIGFIPGWGGTQRALRLIGKARALELILTGTSIDANQAYSLGIVSQVVPSEGLMAACEDLARKVMKNAPLAIKSALQSVNEGIDMSLEDGLSLESKLASTAALSEDAEEGINAFLEKREPVFKGR